ncbi:hypothetical protein TrVE_jg7763 [Triparma verrucosa]|uniref:Uncharacterized protein n=1 Tax=Triparma verrucosa TaxID=1606542 RepID=A0A9W7BLS9_9STRA|nr:hypothetical protein TrVE_jg7763 [Triparma verrucosa]
MNLEPKGERVKVLMEEMGVEGNRISRSSYLKRLVEEGEVDEAWKEIEYEDDVEIISTYISLLKNHPLSTSYLKNLLNTNNPSLLHSKITDSILSTSPLLGLELLGKKKLTKPGIKGYTCIAKCEDVVIKVVKKVWEKVDNEGIGDVVFSNEVLKRALSSSDDTLSGTVWNSVKGYGDPRSYTLMLCEMIRRGESVRVLKEVEEGVDGDWRMGERILDVWEEKREKMYVEFVRDIILRGGGKEEVVRDKLERLNVRDILERKGWNEVDSGFKVFGRKREEKDFDGRRIRDEWDSFESGFRLF